MNMNHLAHKFAAVVVVAAMLIVPFRAAAAWDEVCVHLPLWKTGFAANFHVIHGFRTDRPGLPIAVWEITDDGEFVSGGQIIPPISDNLINRRDLLANKVASNHVPSGTIRVSQTQCVSIEHLREGEPFFVLVDVQGRVGRHYVYCELHPSAEDPWYHQTNRPYRKMVYHAWGVVGNPKCEYRAERN